LSVQLLHDVRLYPILCARAAAPNALPHAAKRRAGQGGGRAQRRETVPRQI